MFWRFAAPEICTRTAAFHSGFHRVNRFHYNRIGDENPNDHCFNKHGNHNHYNNCFNHHGNNNHSSLLENNGYPLSDLGDSKQLIAVVSSGCSAVVYGFSAGEQGWQMDFVSNGCVGTNGVSANSREGISCTPKGLFSLGFAFGTDPLTDLSIPYRQLNENCYWVDDPASPVYNQWQETTEINWNSAEHLIDYASSYHYAVVVNYNCDPVVPGAGSAIFLHCTAGASSTAGCIAVPDSQMWDILHWLREEDLPLILTS